MKSCKVCGERMDLKERVVLNVKTKKSDYIKVSRYDEWIYIYECSCCLNLQGYTVEGLKTSEYRNAMKKLKFKGIVV